MTRQPDSESTRSTMTPPSTQSEPQIEAQATDWPVLARCLGEVAQNNLHDPDFVLRYARALLHTGQRMQALIWLRRAQSKGTESVEIWLTLAELLCEVGAREQAHGLAKRATAKEPANPQALYSEALVLIELFHLDEAIDRLRNLLDLAPTHRPALSTLLYLLNLLPRAEPSAVAQEHRLRTARCYAQEEHLPAAPLISRPRPRSRPLRVGFLSADLREHPVGRFVRPLFDRLDPAGFSIHAYSTGHGADSLTESLRCRSAVWFDGAGVPDAVLERHILDDHLDLLIDLSGHTQGQRLAVLARRPAPIQLTWLGYPNTTGLDGIDYRLLDPVLAPLDECPDGNERVLRLDGSFACFRPPTAAPDIADRSGKQPVFGSLHRLEKLNDAVIRCWAELLRRCPDAQLLIARDQLDAARQAWLRQRFIAEGIPSNRLDLRQLAGDHWPIYQDIDVLLDCFPWSGHTMACEALWMGVPVVTLHGQSVAGRLSASALRAAGHQEWIVNSTKEYVETACRIVAQRAQSADQRANLRELTAASALCNEIDYVDGFGKLMERVAGART